MKGTLHVLLWLVEFAIGLVFIAFVLILIMPWLLTYDGTRAAVFGLFKGPIGGELIIEKAQLSWWGELSIEKLRYTANNGKLCLSCDKLSTPSSLWQIGFGAHELGDLVIENPRAIITLDEQEKSQKVVIQAAGIPSIPVMAHLELQEIWSNLTPHFTGSVSLSNGVLIMEGKNIADVRLENLAFDAKLAQGSDYVKFTLTGTTRQADQTGSLDWSGNFGPLENPDPVLTMQGNIKKLPMLGVDQVTSFFYPRWQGVTVAAIGPTLDLDLQLNLSNQRLDLSFLASSSQFNASFTTTTKEEKISLTAPARFGLMITPFLAQEFFNLSPYMVVLSLANSPRVALDISDLEIPLTQEGISWSQLKINAVLNLLDLEFGTPVLLHGIAFERLQARLNTSLLEEQLNFDSTVSLRFGDEKALVAASGVLMNPLAKNISSTMTLSTKNFPVPILDQLLSSKEFLQHAIGVTCDFSGGIDHSNGQRIGTLSFQSPTIKINNAAFSLEGGLQLSEPVHIIFSPPSTFLNEHVYGVGFGEIDINLQKLDLRHASGFIAQGKATSPQFFYKRFSLGNPSLVFDVQNTSSIRLNLLADGLSGFANLAYSSDKPTITVKDPLTLAFNLNPTQAMNLWREFQDPPTFLAPVSINLSLKPFSVPLGQYFLNNTNIEGSIDSPLLKVQAPNKTTAVVQNATSKWSLDTKNGTITARTDASIGCAEDALVPLHSEMLVRKVNFQPAFNASDMELFAKIAVEKLDTRFIDGWRSEKTALSPLFGSWITLKGDVLKGSASSSLGLDATFEKGSFIVHLAQTGDLLTLDGRNPASATIMLDQASYAALESLLGRQLPVDLLKPTQIDWRVNRLKLPMKKGSFEIDPADLPQATIDSILQTESLSLMERATNKPISLSHLAFRFSRPDVQSPLVFNLKTSIEAAKPGIVDVKGELKGIQHTSKGWDLTHIHALINGNFQQLPTSVVDTLTTAAGMQAETIPTLFGDQMSGNFSATIDDCCGPVSISINSPSTRLSLDGALQNGVLLLNQPFFAQITMTEGISRLFLRGVNPLSISAINSDGPLTLNVDPHGFSLPVLPWNIASATIERARIELGKITCRNQGNISVTLGLLKLGQFSKSKDLLLWFAPMDISLKDGIVSCDRTEILVSNSIEIATWGDIDLVNNRVDAVLGLTAQALSAAFGIKGLPDSYILQIPMRGPIDDVKVDSSKATTKIALLLAWQKASQAGGLMSGPQGALVGGLLGQLAKLPDSSASSPPAKHPFPWEEQPPPPSKPPKKKKSFIKPGEKPLKQLLKLLK